MNTPLIVYLDSSDFSDLSDTKKRTPLLVDAESRLIKWQEQGLIEFRFSQIHLIEAAAVNPEHVNEASARFSVIKEFCNNKCFISYIKVMEQEAIGLSRADPDSPIEVLNNEGNWFPEIRDDEDFLGLETTIHEQIDAIPDRKSRRNAIKKVYNPDGTIRATLRNHWMIRKTSVVDSIAARFPIPRFVIERAVIEFINNGSTRQFTNGIRASLADIRNLGVWYKNDWDKVSPTSSFLRDIGGDLKKSLLEGIEQSVKIAEYYEAIGFDDNKIASLKKASLNNMMESLFQKITEEITHHLGITLIHEADFKRAPTLYTLATVSGYIGKITILSGRKPRESDFGDIYHTAFLPYVDVFRADGFTSSAIAQAKKDGKFPFNNFIVSKFVELPNVIDSILSKR